MTAADLHAALAALGWLPLHAHQRAGAWLVWAAGRAAVGPTIEAATATLLTRFAAGDA